MTDKLFITTDWLGQWWCHITRLKVSRRFINTLPPVTFYRSDSVGNGISAVEMAVDAISVCHKSNRMYRNRRSINFNLDLSFSEIGVASYDPWWHSIRRTFYLLWMEEALQVNRLPLNVKKYYDIIDSILQSDITNHRFPAFFPRISVPSLRLFIYPRAFTLPQYLPGICPVFSEQKHGIPVSFTSISMKFQ